MHGGGQDIQKPHGQWLDLLVLTGSLNFTDPHDFHWTSWTSLTPTILTHLHGSYWPPWSSLAPIILTDPHHPHSPPWFSLPSSSLTSMILTDPHHLHSPPWFSLTPWSSLAPLLTALNLGSIVLLGCLFCWELGVYIRSFVSRFPTGVKNSTQASWRYHSR